MGRAMGRGGTMHARLCALRPYQVTVGLAGGDLVQRSLVGLGVVQLLERKVPLCKFLAHLLLRSEPWHVGKRRGSRIVG